MSPQARTLCHFAIFSISRGDYSAARDALRDALRMTSNRAAWSKIMLAIRELGRVEG